jgi:hypothetical protein
MIGDAQGLGQFHPWLPPAFAAWQEENYIDERWAANEFSRFNQSTFH